jgi:hypothetical protein
MIPQYTILAKLLDAENKIYNCPQHSNLRGNIRLGRREVEKLFDQTEELNYSLLCEHLKSLTFDLLSDCSLCYEPIWEVLAMEEEVRREIETPQSAGSPDVEHWGTVVPQLRTNISYARCPNFAARAAIRAQPL